MSALEAFTNATLGLLVSWAFTFFALGFTASQSVGITACYFFLSFARSWAIREVFRKWV